MKLNRMLKRRELSVVQYEHAMSIFNQEVATQ